MKSTVAETDNVTERIVNELAKYREQPGLIAQLAGDIPDECRQFSESEDNDPRSSGATMIHENNRTTEALGRQVMELQKRIHEYQTSGDVMVLKGGKKYTSPKNFWEASERYRRDLKNVLEKMRKERKSRQG